MKNKFVSIVLKVFLAFLASIVLSLVYYSFFALVYNTDEEKMLKNENRLYRKVLPDVSEKLLLLEDEVEYLRERDSYIYRQVFRADAPTVGEILTNESLLSDNIQASRNVARHAWEVSGRAMEKASRVEKNFRQVMDSLCTKGYVLPPMNTPVEDLQFTSVGASTGDRLSPFYKVPFRHDGLDIVSPQGEPVYATAPGWVTVAKKSSSREGNVVEITHRGGYVTRFTHLQSINVKVDQRVRVGTKIGTVGDSGRSFTTHLHYEVLRDGEPCDPVNYFFGSVGPDEYLKMLVMSASSGQSMD